MSVKVDLDQLATAMADFAFAYLVTVGDDYRAHTVAVIPVLENGVLGIGSVGNSTRRNASSHADVTLVWPPREPGGYTLIVDGAAKVADDADELRDGRAQGRRAAPARHARFSDGIRLRRRLPTPLLTSDFGVVHHAERRRARRNHTKLGRVARCIRAGR